MAANSRESNRTTRDAFLKKYENIQLQKDLEIVEKRIPEFWTILQEIKTHYENSISGYKSALKELIDLISDKDMDKPTIHSIRYRVKDVDSLIVKIIQKSASVPEQPQGNPEIEKYRNITKDNYYKVITDLIGIRILIRYRYQWAHVHRLIWELFHSSEYEYVEDWIKDYKNDPAVSYIAEQPRAYVKQSTDRVIYEEFGKNIFNIRDSDNHYASLHYIINRSGRYCEMQVRTIFDEAWCECNHDFVYKSNVKTNKDKDTLERLSVILSQHTTAAESIVSLMCDLAQPSTKRNSRGVNKDNSESRRTVTERQAEIFAAVNRRAEGVAKLDLSVVR